ncbi:retrovirus-related Pol polyprotein from transposon 412 isoform X2 [Corythoichthys intestinalis]|uniref:retrovirus-related Pol polyprotein from transposon 412 isoform X2 n=1 Tax=Corythoichthys intestinalis TaxID=161448 RepID=UPI0025A59C7C|nr:retrovirus-related Pol polyprotein from transposon 412 isoform X2 [Corythoichthys intestinalis]
MRLWSPSSGFTHDSVCQIVVPKPFRTQVLCLAHDHCMSGHLGVRKTYNRILRFFFWPGLKSDVVKYCQSCHTCQVSGKPNQVVSAAPLRPIPVVGEPFSHVIVDCVGPLPRTKSGNIYILTIMCASTRFPEAIPLRSLKTRAIVKALVKFFSTFGLPKSIQSDQGSNFMSKVFAQVMSELNIKHHASSAYHPESQGALERFHQTLKSMLCKFCTESNREWDEGLPLLLFAIRETPQESLGFSPADLVFGHTVRGPLRLLREKWLSDNSNPEQNMLDYVSSFRERLHHACDLARNSMKVAQSNMKIRYDKKAVVRTFQPGDQVLVLLPIVGAALRSKFSGLYVIDRKLSETDYVLQTPDRRKKTRVCHINMLKPYIDRDKSTAAPITALSAAQPPYHPSVDGLNEKHSSTSCARLQNSEVLMNLEVYLAHLSSPARSDICNLIHRYSRLFQDIPSQTKVLEHDIDVEDHKPIKQHAYRVNPTKRAMMEKEMQNSNQRLMRWSLLLQDFNIEVHHKKGNENVLADALSRAL